MIKEGIHRIVGIYLPDYRPWMMRMLAWSLSCVLLFFAILKGVDFFSTFLLLSSGYVAITSEDFRFLFSSFQGYTILIITALILFLTVGTLLNTGILLSSNLINGRQSRPLVVLRDGFLAIRFFLVPEGIPVLVYFFIAIPVFTFTVMFFFNTPFEIPGFILYVLGKKLIYRIIYILSVILLFLIAIKNLLLVHRVILEKQNPADASKDLKNIIRLKRKWVYCRIGALLLSSFAEITLIHALYNYLPEFFHPLPRILPEFIKRFLMIFSIYLGIVAFTAISLLFFPLFITELTRLYYCCCQNEVVTLPLRETRHGLRGQNRPAPNFSKKFADISPTRHSKMKKMNFSLSVIFLAVLFVLTTISVITFDTLFPAEVNAVIVEHRLGGSDEAENTLEGQKIGISKGAQAAETDVQRTIDGYYVIFHDSNAKRLCGVDRKICDMTLEEVQSLRVTSPEGEERKIPLLEEVLEEAKDTQTLFIELKGKSADEEMADDIILMIRGYDMQESCVLISMHSDIISYIHQNYDDIKTGLIYFFAYGNESLLDVDMLIVQANAISQSLISSVHEQNKQIYAWTVNRAPVVRRILRMGVDGIITDRYEMISRMKDSMSDRSDYIRIIDRLNL